MISNYTMSDYSSQCEVQIGRPRCRQAARLGELSTDVAGRGAAVVVVINDSMPGSDWYAIELVIRKANAALNSSSVPTATPP
jgi:hypothetical protein